MNAKTYLYVTDGRASRTTALCETHIHVGRYVPEQAKLCWRMRRPVDCTLEHDGTGRYVTHDPRRLEELGCILRKRSDGRWTDVITAPDDLRSLDEIARDLERS